MSQFQGKFVWYDLMADDIDAARAFYTNVVGWDARASGLRDGAYTTFLAGPRTIGGVSPISAGARANGVRPHWSGYIAVDDVDCFSARVKSAGGEIHRPPEDIDGFGRLAVVSDPHGARFILLQGAKDPTPVHHLPGAPGHIGWHELQAGDLDSDFAFYSDLFGWARAEAMDVGPLVVYQTFSKGGPAFGGMMTRLSVMPSPHWLYYFNVEDVVATIGRVVRNRGKVIYGPLHTPGAQLIAQCIDPQGAMFAVIGQAP